MKFIIKRILIFSSKTLFRLKTFYRITTNQILRARLIVILESIYTIYNTWKIKILSVINTKNNS